MSDQTGNSSTVISSGILPTFPTHSRHCLTAASILGDPPIEWMDGRLMEKEKKWRRDNGHCLCCHYPGHIAETCTLGVKKKGKGMEFIKETQETGKVSCNISFPVPTAPPPAQYAHCHSDGTCSHLPQIQNITMQLFWGSGS